MTEENFMYFLSKLVAFMMQHDRITADDLDKIIDETQQEGHHLRNWDIFLAGYALREYELKEP